MAFTSSATAEHYTPWPILEMVRQTMGGIDVDPCSCEIAQRSVRAKRYLTKDDDGLSSPWYRSSSNPARVFINPPGDRRGHLPKEFWRKLAREIRAGHVSQMVWLAFNLAQLRTLQVADNNLLKQCDLVVLRDRLRFTGDSPTKDNAVLYWGPWPIRFASAFGAAGTLWRAQNPPL